MVELNHCPQCGCKMPPDAPSGLCPDCLFGVGLGMSDPDLGDPPVTEARVKKGFVPPKPKDLADRFPQFEILDLLGYGGMGAVYKAKQKSLDRFVALKIIKPDAADDPGFAERFAREARALARLNHSAIVGVHDFGETHELRGEKLFYFVMEYVDGTNLRQLIESKELSPHQALQIIPQVCEALQFAHDEGIVHRDIKPENILVDIKGRVKIADFGLAKLLGKTAIEDHTLTGTHQVMGTPRYMAPEQMEGSRAVDHRADIYSLGVVFYEMLTGELPMGSFEPPSRKVQVDVRLDEVVLRSLAKEPERRYQHASDVRTDLEAISSSMAIAPYVSAPTYRNSRENPSDSKFSRKAILGACWIPLFFVGLFAVAMPWVSIEVHHGTTEPPAWAWWRYLLVIVVSGFGLVGVAAPFATTIFGFVAMNDIRHSQGQLRGLGLAFFDALFFPLLIVDVFIGVGVFQGVQAVAPLGTFVCLAAALFMILLTNVPFLFWGWGRVSSDTRRSRQIDKSTPADWSPISVGMCLILPLLAVVAFAMFYAGSAWVLAAVALPWIGIGVAGMVNDGKPRERATNVLALVTFLLSLMLIAFGIWVEASAWPLMGIFAGIGGAIIGMLLGSLAKSEEEAKPLADASATEAEEEEDAEGESPEEKLEWAAWWIGLIGAVRAWALFTTSGSLFDKLIAGDMSFVNHTTLLHLTGPVMVIAGIATYHARLYWLAVVGAVLCLPTGNCAPVFLGIYSLVTLFDPKVRALFLANEAMLTAPGFSSDDSSRPSKPPMPRGYGDAIGSTLSSAWTEWWRERDALFTRGVQTVIMLLHIACLFAFLGFSSGTSQMNGERKVLTHDIGFPSPWFTIETSASYPDFSFRHAIHWSLSAWAAAAIGLGLAYIYCRIEKVRNPDITFWNKPEAFMLVWAILAVADIGLGAGMMHLATNTNRPGPPITSQVVEAADIHNPKRERGTDEKANPDESAVTRPGGEVDSSVATLLDAVQQGNFRLIKAQLDAGASVNEKDSQGRTLLMHAIASGNRSLALTLVVLGADLTEQDARGMTAMMVAVEARDRVFLSRLRELTQIASKQDAEERKAELRAFSGVERSLLEGRDFDLRNIEYTGLECQKNADGETASLMAARLGDWELYCQVATHVDSIEARDNRGRTVAMQAAIYGHVDWFKRLASLTTPDTASDLTGPLMPLDLKHLALKDNDGQTALQLASENAHVELADFLWSHLQTIIDAQTKQIEDGGDPVAERIRWRDMARQAFGEPELTKRLDDEASDKGS
ncbi:MAG: protein kinase [Planctomycetaceae bacterium]|nr:protein kinase [Planctomycetaceae bacterium]